MEHELINPTPEDADVFVLTVDVEYSPEMVDGDSFDFDQTEVEVVADPVVDVPGLELPEVIADPVAPPAPLEELELADGIYLRWDGYELEDVMREYVGGRYPLDAVGPGTFYYEPGMGVVFEYDTYGVRPESMTQAIDPYAS